MSTLFNVIVVTLILTCDSKCPDDTWTPGSDPDTCYHVTPAKHTWHSAHEYCGQLGGYLAEINTKAEQTFLETVLSGSDYYWIGLSDLAHTGQWTWQHSYSPPSWTHWADGEPDGGGQHCAMIWGGQSYYWADKECNVDSVLSGHNLHGLCEMGPGPAPQVTKSVLWIGNSFTYRNDVPNIVAQLAAADGINVEYDSHAEGGWTWQQHSTSQITLDKIRSRSWDTVILQEYSRAPAYPGEVVCKDSVPYLDILAEEITTNSPDTLIQFYLAWAYAFGYSTDCDNGLSQFCSYSSMQDALSSGYLDFACMKAVSNVAPVGEAFRYIHDTQSQEFFLSLYEDNGQDKHAALPGSYLSALVHYAALFNTSVTGNTVTMGLASDTVSVLQQAADVTWSQRDWLVSSDCNQCLCGCN